MKILVAIVSTKNAEQMVHTTLRWAGRAGYDLRVFIPDRRQYAKYAKYLDEANYFYYFNLIPEDVLVPKQTPVDYAKQHGYELIVYLPDDILDYKTEGNDDKTFIEYAADVGMARSKFASSPAMSELKLNNGVVMARV